MRTLAFLLAGTLTVGCASSKNAIDEYIQEADPTIQRHYDLVEDIRVDIPLSAYLAYKARDHLNSKDSYADYVTPDDPYIKQLAEKLTTGVEKDKEKVQRILAFVYHHGYDLSTDEQVSGDYVKYPLETIVEGGGDCEDLSILGVSLLLAAGFNSVPIHVPPREEDASGHIAMGIAGDYEGAGIMHEGTIYFYTDPPGRENPFPLGVATIGHMPEKYEGRVLTVLPVAEPKHLNTNQVTAGSSDS